MASRKCIFEIDSGSHIAQFYEVISAKTTPQTGSGNWIPSLLVDEIGEGESQNASPGLQIKAGIGTGMKPLHTHTLQLRINGFDAPAVAA